MAKINVLRIIIGNFGISINNNHRKNLQSYKYQWYKEFCYKTSSFSLASTF